MTETTATPQKIAAGPFRLEKDSFGRLVLVDSAGARFVGVETYRAFPISAPRQWFSICDSDGKEIVLLKDPSVLAPEVLQKLEEEISRREFVPVIEKIISLKADTDPAEWDVVTDRGRTFFLIDGDDDVRRLGDNGAILCDTHGIRYLIPDLRELDGPSRRLLGRYF